MVCSLTCAIAFGLILASMFVCFDTKAKMLKHELVQTMCDEQKEIYKKIVHERFMLYIQGMVLGVVIAFIYLLMQKKRDKMHVCAFFAIMLSVSYFYYILSKKSDWLVPHLDQEQSAIWIQLYRECSYKYHLGFLVGLLGFSLLAYGGLCK